MNNDDNNPDEGNTSDASWSLDVEIEAPIGPHGQAFALIEAGQGDRLTDEAEVGDVLFGVNDDAGDSAARLEVTEVWYEHRLWHDRLAFTLGKVDLTNYFDAHTVANDETSQFLATGLVNAIAVEFPVENGAGARLTVSPTPFPASSAGGHTSPAAVAAPPARRASPPERPATRRSAAQSGLDNRLRMG